MKQIVPIIVSTLEGMQNACRDDAACISLEEHLMGSAAEQLALQHGYRRAEQSGRRCVFYRSSRLPAGGMYEIWDPMEIL